MSSFTDDIYLKTLGFTSEVQICKTFAFYSEIEYLKTIVYAGFISDLASIPPILQSFTRAQSPKHWRAFVIHDALYRVFSTKKERKKADLILDEALTITGLSRYARAKIYYGLRIFGRLSSNFEAIQNANLFIETQVY